MLNPQKKSFKKFQKPLTVTLPRSFVTGLLSFVYVLAFIITDYWNVPESSIVKSAILIVTILLGIFWCYFAGASSKVIFDPKDLLYFFLFLIGFFILNYKSLTSVLPWRGDEDHHIIETLGLINQLNWYAILIVILIWGIILYLAWDKPGWAILAGLFFLWQATSIYPKHLAFANLRYPFISYWLFGLIPKLASLVTSPYHEVLFRIIPFLSVVIVAWLFQRSLHESKDHINILWGIAVVTIPVVLYYSSILYLDLLAILLMTIVCLNIDNLLIKDFAEIKRETGWYALILIGFIKETTLPFLICFLIFRSIISLWRKKKKYVLGTDHIDNERKKALASFRIFLKNELLIFFVTLFPLIIYFTLRLIFSPSMRGYSLNLVNLLDAQIYSVLAQSIFEQFGLFLLLFLGGCVFLAITKNYVRLSFFLMVFLAYSLFFLLDQKLYVGYSRFSLYFLPPILAGSSALLKNIRKKKKLCTLIACLTIALSIMISPIQSDGTKVPFWGNHLCDTSEHYYPYDKAISWLHETKPDAKILFAGLNYPYYFDFYLKKINWHPANFTVFYAGKYRFSSIANPPKEIKNLKNALFEAQKGGYNVVFYHILGIKLPQMPRLSNYRLEKIFANKGHILVVYQRDF